MTDVIAPHPAPAGGVASGTGLKRGSRIVVTGVTGSVGEPVATALARDHEVFGLARFSHRGVRERLEAAGVACVPFDLVSGDVGTLPDDVDHVADFALANTGDWNADLAANAETLGLLMHRYASASSFLVCSSTAVYAPAGHTPLTETSPLGDSHRDLMETYSIVKVAAEAVARTQARIEGLPTTIARLNVPYGPRCGLPSFHLAMLQAGMPIDVHPDRPNLFNPIHLGDIIRMVPLLFGVASVPATILNWGGDDVVSVEEWCTELGRLGDLDVSFTDNPTMPGSVVVDLTRMHELIGHTQVPWREGMARMIAQS